MIPANDHCLERQSQPIRFDWSQDPLEEGRGKEAFFPVPFTESSDDATCDTSADYFTGYEQVQDVPDSPAGEALGGLNTARGSSHESGDSNKRSFASFSSTDSVRISRRKKKPKGMPKRPLSAYNLYFQAERTKILEAAAGEGGKIGFEGLGKMIGKKWKALSEIERKAFEKLAEKDSTRYRNEMEAYNEMKAKRLEESEKCSIDLTSSSPANFSATSDPRPSRSGAMLESKNSSIPPVILSNIIPTITSNIQSPLLSDNYSQISVSHEKQKQYPSLQGEQSRANLSFPSYPKATLLCATPVSCQAHNHSADYGLARSTVLSMPPATFQQSLLSSLGAEALPPNHLPIPPGMEIVLPDRNGKDRKYRVHYTCHTMTRDAAEEFMESFARTPFGLDASKWGQVADSRPDSQR